MKRDGRLDEYARVRRTFEESLRLAREAETPEGCWPWPTAAPNGYPTSVKDDGGSRSAYVVAYTRDRGPVPDGLTLDHLCHTNSADCGGGPSCRHRRCVRPSHLEPVSMWEQRHRDKRYTSNTCINGHDLTDDNVRIVVEPEGNSYRQCAKCSRANTAASYYKRCRLGLAEGDTRHGTVTGYRNYGCRCTACRAAGSTRKSDG